MLRICYEMTLHYLLQNFMTDTSFLTKQEKTQQQKTAIKSALSVPVIKTGTLGSVVWCLSSRPTETTERDNLSQAN